MVSQHPAKVSNRKVVRVRVAAVPPFYFIERRLIDEKFIDVHKTMFLRS